MVKLKLQLFALEPGWKVKKQQVTKDVDDWGKLSINNSIPNLVVNTANAVVDKQKSTGSNGSNSSSSSSGGSTSSSSGGSSGGGLGISGVSGTAASKINSTFKTSKAYEEAMAQTQAILDKINAGKTSYTDQIKELMAQIQGRDPFSYDVDSDMLFQQYLGSMMNSGQTAMRDTIGQASALTGGYGSTYATSAGNQAYNQYIQEAYNNLPEYYNMAMQAYQMEGDEMYNQLAMLNSADATEYGRLVDSYSANSSMANQLYAQEYQAYSDDQNKWLNIANMQNSDYWNSANLAESKRQHDQSQANWVATNDVNGDGKVDSKDLVASQSSEDEDLVYPNDKILENAVSIYNNQGEDAYYNWLKKLPSNIDLDAVDSHVSANQWVGLKGRTFTKTADNIYQDQYGNKFTKEDLDKLLGDDGKALTKALKKLKINEMYTYRD